MYLDFNKIDLILNKIFSYNVKPPRLAEGNIHIAEAADFTSQRLRTDVKLRGSISR